MLLHRLMYPLLLFLAFSLVLAQSPVIEQASKLEEEGSFIEAATLLGSALAAPSVSPELRKNLEFELDRLDRIKKDYSLTRERLLETLLKSVNDLSLSEFESWIEEGRFDSRLIDSVRYFMESSRSNLFFRHPELAARRINPPDDSEFERSALQAVSTIKKAAMETGTPYVLPKDFRNTMRVTVKSNAVPAGETIRAWLPIPRAFPHQTAASIVSSSSPSKSVSDGQSSIRSAYLEQKALKEKPTVFSVEYTYKAYGVWFDLKPLAVEAYDPSEPDFQKYIAEGPHVAFTTGIRFLSHSIAGSEGNVLLKAKKFYDWISENIQYSYALEYSTIRNISEYCMNKKYGDCGQAALLFITLCRYNGIPARWQSGWLTIPGRKTIHDWTEIYVKPYGWFPVDPYLGVFAMQYFGGPAEQRKEIRDFYFGGLDQYRVAANSDHCQELMPPKRSMRSDNVDFQRGELEYGDANIYFDKYSFDLKVEEVR